MLVSAFKILALYLSNEIENDSDNENEWLV